MKVLYIEPFYGGSHRNFADGWIRRSRHDFHLITLPARFWKWRYTGSALHFAETIDPSLASGADAMVLGGMGDLAHLKALRPDLPPALLYVHENQLAYPVSDGREADYRYRLPDLASMLAADRLVFNSNWNRDSFVRACDDLLRRLPDARPSRATETIRSRSRVVYPGVDVEIIHRHAEARRIPRGNEPPVVVWNHRHEHDKAPEVTVRVLRRLAGEGLDFRIVLLGERYTRSPADFDVLRRELPERILFDDYPDRPVYMDWLTRCDIVLSSAIQENFGIAVVEAMAAGCLPLCPDRLAYPEVIPGDFHGRCLWKDEEEFASGLRALLAAGSLASDRAALADHVRRYDWSVTAGKLDTMLEEMSVAPADQGEAS